MPYYKITVTDVNGKTSQGVRFDAMNDIEAYYGKVHRKALLSLKLMLKSVDVVMLREGCPDVQAYLEKRKNSVVWRPSGEAPRGKDKYAYRNLINEEKPAREQASP